MSGETCEQTVMPDAGTLGNESDRNVKSRHKKRVAPQVSIELDEAAVRLAKSLVPQSAHDTWAALRNGARGVHGNTQYRPATVEAIIRNLMRGVTRGAAAELAGIRAKTLYDWTGEHPDLAEALARAEAHVEHDLIQVVRSGFERNPRLALELLERRFPRQWAQQGRVEHSGAVMHGLVGNPDWLQQLALARAKRDARTESLSGGQRPTMLSNSQGSGDFATTFATRGETAIDVAPAPPAPLPPPPAPHDGGQEEAGGPF